MTASALAVISFASAAVALHPVDLAALPGVPTSPIVPPSLHAGYLNTTYNDLSLRTFAIYSEHADVNAPLIVWMNGGPGASSLMGFFNELGPYLINGGSVPPAGSASWQLRRNAYSWATIGSLLAWEQPAGVGFSRCVAGPCEGFVWNDTSSATANFNILSAFFDAHPAERSRDVYIIGESYGGVYVPLLASHVVANANEIPIKLKGIAVGNGCVGFAVEGGCGIDSLDLFVGVLENGAPGVDRAILAAARGACGDELRQGKQTAADLTPPCAAALVDVFEEVAVYNQYSWGSPCGPDGDGNWGEGAAFECGGSTALSLYLTTLETQKALHVVAPTASVPLAWQMWDGDSPFYNITAANVLPTYEALLAASKVPVLIYNGLRDTGVPALGARRWVPTVGGVIAAPRRKWAPVAVRSNSTKARNNNAPWLTEIGGHVTVYENGLTYVEVIGAGHLVPAERPRSAHTMIESWVGGRELPEYLGPKCKRLWLGRGYGTFCK